jgi:hypothetical protein
MNVFSWVQSAPPQASSKLWVDTYWHRWHPGKSQRGPGGVLSQALDPRADQPVAALVMGTVRIPARRRCDSEGVRE